MPNEVWYKHDVEQQVKEIEQPVKEKEQQIHTEQTRRVVADRHIVLVANEAEKSARAAH